MIKKIKNKFFKKLSEKEQIINKYISLLNKLYNETEKLELLIGEDRLDKETFKLNIEKTNKLFQALKIILINHNKLENNENISIVIKYLNDINLEELINLFERKEIILKKLEEYKKLFSNSVILLENSKNKK